MCPSKLLRRRAGLWWLCAALLLPAVPLRNSAENTRVSKTDNDSYKLIASCTSSMDELAAGDVNATPFSVTVRASVYPAMVRKIRVLVRSSVPKNANNSDETADPDIFSFLPIDRQ